MYPKGSYITKDGERRKVLEVLGDLRFVSMKEPDRTFNNDWETQLCALMYPIQLLQRDGWIEEKIEEKWEPKKGCFYWYIESSSASANRLFNTMWQDDSFDFSRRDFLGIYPTRESAEAALAEIKRKLKS